jgi:hypothetical protein
VCKSVIVLYLIVVTTCRLLIKPITNPNRVSVTQTCYNIYINDIVIVVSENVDNALLKMADLTETCQGRIIKNHNFC